MSSRRLWVLVGFLVAGATVVLGRSLQITVVEHDQWRQRARRQHERVLRVPGARGQIRSADGYVLATSVDRVAIQVDTRYLSYQKLFARAVATLLERPAEELERRLECGPRTVWLAQRVDREVAEAVRRLAPAATVLVPDSERAYPLGPVAAPIIGFVGREELRIVGRAGLEHHFDDLLAGEPEQYLAVNDAVQRQVRLERLHPGRAGYDIELTVHARLQAECEAELARAMAATRARSASAVVLEAATGTVLALASLPSFDPETPGDALREWWRLRPVQDAFEPGSTMKPLIAATALAAGVVRPGERFDCTHRGVRVAGRWIRDHADPGTYTLDEVIAHSANAGIVAVAERIPPELLRRAFSAFGFGRRTKVGFPAEANGVLQPLERWSRLSSAGHALGQELTTSPLQLALAYAAIANGGWLPRPRLVRRATATGSSISGAGEWPNRVMDEALSRRLTRMLEAAVEDGTGDLAGIPGYRVAGKTGTAQRLFAGRFDDEHHVAWFAGFLPLPDPRWVIVVAIEDPVSDFWASTVAAPPFAAIAQCTVRLFDVPPDAPAAAHARHADQQPRPGAGGAA